MQGETDKTYQMSVSLWFWKYLVPC